MFNTADYERRLAEKMKEVEADPNSEWMRDLDRRYAAFLLNASSSAIKSAGKIIEAVPPSASPAKLKEAAVAAMNIIHGATAQIGTVVAIVGGHAVPKHAIRCEAQIRIYKEATTAKPGAQEAVAG